MSGDRWWTPDQYEDAEQAIRLLDGAIEFPIPDDEYVALAAKAVLNAIELPPCPAPLPDDEADSLVPDRYGRIAVIWTTLTGNGTSARTRCYLDIRCDFQPFSQCGGRCGEHIALAVHENFDAYENVEGEWEWSHRVKSWELVCDAGHVHCSSEGLYGDDEDPPLPTVKCAMWSLPEAGPPQ